MTFTKNQAKAIGATGRHLCVDAGAGSGKTRVLVERIINLLREKRVKLHEIVAFTFMERAALEMKARLRQACRENAPADDPDEMTYWREIERQVDTARISTIHSFCASLLREHALALGIDPDFALLEEAESRLLRKEVVKNALHGMLEEKDDALLTLVLEHGLQNVMRTFEYLVGKGALMDRVMERDYVYLDPNELLSHWKKLIADEGARRILKLARSPERGEYLEQLKSFEGECSKPSDAYEAFRCAAVDFLVEIEHSPDAQSISNKAMKLTGMSFTGSSKKNWLSEERLNELKSVAKEVRKWAAQFRFPEWDPDAEMRAADLTVAAYRVYKRVAEAYDDAKTGRNAMDFDDLITRTLHLLRDNAELRDRIARGIRHLLIDEFQDTDSAQLAIARCLMAAGDQPGAELFIVGDAKQSIYDFRGAEVEVFSEAKDHADEVIPLNINFRTVPDTLHFINDFFEKPWIRANASHAFEPLEPHRDGLTDARIELLVPNIEDEDNAEEARGKEAELIANRILEMCDGPDRVSVLDPDTDEARPATYGDVAILFRSTSSLHLYEDALRSHNVPFDVVAGASFFRRQEISDLRNLLTAVIDPRDEMALLGFLRSPLASLSDEALMELCAEQPLAEAFDCGTLTDSVDQQRLDDARALLADLRRITESPLPAFMRYVLDRTGIEAILLAQYLGVQKASNVRKLVELAEEFSRARVPRLTAFVRYLSEITEQEIGEGEATLHMGDRGSVTIMTVHKAKGLEFPIVFVADAGRGLRNHSPEGFAALHRRLGMACRFVGDDGETAKPAMIETIQEAEKEQSAAEHARILYVALTRARDRLVIAGAQMKRDKGSWLSHLLDAFDLAEANHGHEFKGNQWKASVRRTPAAVSVHTPANSGGKPADPEILERRAAPVHAANAHRSTFSVSELLPEPDEASIDTDSIRPATGINPIERGNAVHRVLERWDFFEPPERVVNAVLLSSYPALNVRGMLHDYLVDLCAQMRRTDLFRRLSTDSNLRRELEFFVRTDDGMLISGMIDAFLSDGTIIDYKTGTKRDDAHNRYERQLRLYAAALVRLGETVAPEAILYYVDERREIPVTLSEPLLDAAWSEAQTQITKLRSA